VRVSDRLLLIVAPAAALACADLIVKATVPTASDAFHHRSNAWVVMCLLLLVGAAVLSVVPSAAVALAGGVMSAGVLGNLVSARADGNWVPNPLVVTHGQYAVAFNLADVFFLLGNVLLMTALIVEVMRHRERFAARAG
jgi:lipoprotein signal peptidase